MPAALAVPVPAHLVMSDEWVAQDDTGDYVWLVVFGVIVAFTAAFGIGANDVANA